MPDAFPTLEEGGPRETRLVPLPPDWKPLILSHTYEDGGISVLSKGDTPVYRWQITYDDLDEAEADILDTHYESCNHNELTFSFTDREGVTWTGVRYESYERPQHDKVWIQKRTIGLVRYP